MVAEITGADLQNLQYFGLWPDVVVLMTTSTHIATHAEDCRHSLPDGIMRVSDAMMEGVQIGPCIGIQAADHFENGNAMVDKNSQRMVIEQSYTKGAK